MKSRSLFLLAGAITLATATALTARVLMRPAPPKTITKEVVVSKPPPRQILVAGRELLPGDFIDGSALAWSEASADGVRADNISADNDTGRHQLEQQFYGATLRQPIASGQALTRNLFVYPGKPGFIAAVLAPGMRAVSIPTSMVASNAGLVGAGDRVDVILSLARDELAASNEGAGNVYAALAAQTILHDVRVLALNSDVDSIAPSLQGRDSDAADSDSGRRSNRAGNNLHRNYDSVTLEVTPAEAEQLALTREIGTLQLALRGARDADAAMAPEHSVTRLRQATAIFGESPRPMTVQTFRGNEPGAAVLGSAK
jgi:pilus assembly protein CpaB